MSKKLTERQSRFIDNYVGCGNASEAARKAGYSEKTAGEIGHENLKKPEIRGAIAERMDQAGLTEPRLLKVLYEGLEAMLVKTATHEGKITDSRAFPNYATRHRYLDTALKLRDMFPVEKKNLKHDFNNDYTPEKCQEAYERVKKMLRDEILQEEEERRKKMMVNF